MNRTQLEARSTAAADVVGVIDLVVLGSQAILGSYEDWLAATRGGHQVDGARGLVSREICLQRMTELAGVAAAHANAAAARSFA